MICKLAGMDFTNVSIHKCHDYTVYLYFVSTCEASMIFMELQNFYHDIFLAAGILVQE